jgi:alkylation response protein AidB-like acyl-CoA dehydrogenase
VGDLIQAYVRTDKKAPVSRGMSVFWVPKDSPGMTYNCNRFITTGFTGNTQICYDNVRVPEENLLGQVNKGFSIIESIFTYKWTATAPILGSLQKLYEQMREYASERVVGGQPLIKHTGIAAKLGELAVSIESARNMLYKVAWESDQNEKAKKINWFWNMAYYVDIKKVAWRFLEISTDVYGGIVASVDLPLEGFLRSMFVSRAAGMTLEANLLKASAEYDNRY